MNKLVALSALILFVQQINSSPVAETVEVERAIETSKLPSVSSIFPPQKQHRQRRSDFETTPGLKCWMIRKGRPEAHEQDCDEMQGAKYCATVTTHGFVYKTCAVEMVAVNFNAIGLNTPTCKETGGYKLCLCEGSLCNA